ncbi:MAG: hypothetical protein DME67_02300 [Verrucomicrobia bacterium]|nr:MAG: hypothetical protein DME67_02300 [Verrucomicrobiota bacterium]
MKPSLRAAVIAEWRGLPERRMRADRWQLPAELVPKMMQRLGLRERLHETEVIETWSKIVGEFIATHSAPFALRDGILYVRPRKTSCESSKHASAAKSSATFVSASAEDQRLVRCFVLQS